MHHAPALPPVRIVACLGGLLVGLALAAGPAAAMDDHEASCSPGLVEATTTPMFAHFEKAHLERSPMQQAADAQATGDYVALHQVWIESFTAPASAAATTIAVESSTPFMAHMEKAHIQRSPTDQVADAGDTDQYVLMHTMLFESMGQPALNLARGGSC